MKTALCIAYVIGIVIAYIAFRIWTDFDNDDGMIALAFFVAVFWLIVVPIVLCVIIVWLIGKGLDRVAVAVRDAILRVKEKRGRGR